MPKYLSNSEIDEKLGLPTEADKIRNAEVVELKDNQKNPAPAPKRKKQGNSDSNPEAGTEQELAVLKARVAELENGSKQDEDVLSKVLTKLGDAIAEVKTTVEGLLTANSELGEKVAALEETKPNPEAEAILNGRLEELENWKAEKLAEEEAAKAAEEAVDKDELCPACGANVNFKGLPIEKEYGNMNVDLIKYYFSKDENAGREVVGLFRQCPECQHKEPVSEEAEVSEVG